MGPCMQTQPYGGETGHKTLQTQTLRGRLLKFSWKLFLMAAASTPRPACTYGAAEGGCILASEFVGQCHSHGFGVLQKTAMMASST